jgi:hypothetical protein
LSFKKYRIKNHLWQRIKIEEHSKINKLEEDCKDMLLRMIRDKTVKKFLNMRAERKEGKGKERKTGMKMQSTG